MNNFSPWNSQVPVENSQTSFDVHPLMFLYHQEKIRKNQNVGRTMTDDVARNLQVCKDSPKVFCKSNIVHPYPAVVVPIQYVKVTVELWQKNPDANCPLSADEQRVHMTGNRVAIAHRLKPPKHLGKKGPKMRIVFIGEDAQGHRNVIGESEDLVIQAKILEKPSSTFLGSIGNLIAELECALESPPPDVLLCSTEWMDTTLN